MRVAVFEMRDELATALIERLCQSDRVESCERVELDSAGGLGGADVIVLSPYQWSRRIGDGPDLSKAAALLDQSNEQNVRHVVLLSSAAAMGPHHYNPCLSWEGRNESKCCNPIALRWRELEALARERLGDDVKLTILRPAWTLTAGGHDFPSRLFRSRIVFPLFGYDPSLQLLSVSDLSRAVACAVERSSGGTYNIAPTSVMPARRAIRLSAARRFSAPRPFQRLVRFAAARLGLAHSIHQVDFLRYNFTVSGDKAERELGFTPEHSTAEVIARFAGVDLERASEKQRWFVRGCEAPDYIKTAELPATRRFPDFDPHGLDWSYIQRAGRWWVGPATRFYFRAEVRGLENIPESGAAVLAGAHRGFIPLDGKVLLHLITRRAGRVPRFLVHPCLLKHPVLSPMYVKLGGMPACEENAHHVLENDGLLGIFPEGIRGAFRKYNREIYQLGSFARHDFVKIALRYGAPIVPFVTIGHAETYPILANVDWGWWKRFTEWPSMPITFTWPFLPPAPLPSKWHVEYLPPIDVSQYGPEAADDRRVVAAISNQYREMMQTRIDELLARRKHIFWGSIFEDETQLVEDQSPDERLSAPTVIESEQEGSRMAEAASGVST